MNIQMFLLHEQLYKTYHDFSIWFSNYKFVNSVSRYSTLIQFVVSPIVLVRTGILSTDRSCLFTFELVRQPSYTVCGAS